MNLNTGELLPRGESNYYYERISEIMDDLTLYLIFGLGFLLCKFFFQFLFKRLKPIIFRPQPALEKNPQALSKSVLGIISKADNQDHMAGGLQQFNEYIKSHSLDCDLEPVEILIKMQKSGISPDITTYNSLLDAAFTSKNTLKGVQLFNEMKDISCPIHPDVVTYNIYLKGLNLAIAAGGFIYLITIYTIYIVYILYIYIGRDVTRKEISSILGEMEKNDIEANLITFNTVIDLWVSQGVMEEAWNYFDQMHRHHHFSPDVFTYSTLIKGIKKHENSINNLYKLFELISIQGCKCENPEAEFDEILFNSLIDAFGRFGDVEGGERTLALMRRLGLSGSGMTYGILIKIYGHKQMIDRAFELFSLMGNQGIARSEVTYGCILEATIKCDRLDLFDAAYQQMIIDNIPPNLVIATTLIKGFGRAKMFQKALRIYQEMLKSEDIRPNLIAYNSMLDCCVQCNQFDKLKDIFEDLVRESGRVGEYEVIEPDLISYSTLIKGLSKSGQMEKVIELYEEMKEKQMILDEVLFNSIIHGFARGKDIESAMLIYREMEKLHIPKSNVTYSILIKLYSSSRQVEKALSMYSEMISGGVTPGVIVYTCLMQTCIKNKLIDRAITLYYDMQANSVHPDHVTYNTIVNGCVFAGKLQKACDILINSFADGVCLAQDIYDNVLRNLLTNRKISKSVKLSYASQITNYIQVQGRSVDKQLYGRVLNMLYNGDSNMGMGMGNRSHTPHTHNNHNNHNNESSGHKWRNMSNTMNNSSSSYTSMAPQQTYDTMSHQQSPMGGNINIYSTPQTQYSTGSNNLQGNYYQGGNYYGAAQYYNQGTYYNHPQQYYQNYYYYNNAQGYQGDQGDQGDQGTQIPQGIKEKKKL